MGLISSGMLDKTKSRLLFLEWIGSSTTCDKLLSKTKSQKLSDRSDEHVREDQLTSGRLKSPIIRTELVDVNFSRKDRMFVKSCKILAAVT